MRASQANAINLMLGKLSVIHLMLDDISKGELSVKHINDIKKDVKKVEKKLVRLAKGMK